MSGTSPIDSAEGRDQSEPRPLRAMSGEPAAMGQSPPQIIAPAELSESDPGLHRRLKRNAKGEVTLFGRRVSLETDDYGRRPVLGQPAAGEKTLAVYGCSFTYGNPLPFEDTFCSVLQSFFPSWRVENHGVGAFGGMQNLIQLRRNSRWSRADYVTFCFIDDHRLRNVADISWLRRITRNPPSGAKPRPFPRAAIARDGGLALRYAMHPRWDLDGIDVSDFRHDDYYLDLVAALIFERAAEIVRANGGHFFLTVLRGQLSPLLRARLEQSRIPIVNASVQGREYTCLPEDPHPNALAHRHFAERIRDYLIEAEVAPRLATSPPQPTSA